MNIEQERAVVHSESEKELQVNKLLATLAGLSWHLISKTLREACTPSTSAP
jgi:hypothetical protein